jgi:hypothetical protein
MATSFSAGGAMEISRCLRDRKNLMALDLAAK